MTDKKETEKFIEFALQCVKDGKDFLSEQAPEFVREILVWQRISLSVQLVLLLVGALVAWRVGIRCVVWFKSIPIDIRRNGDGVEVYNDIQTW